MDKQEKSQDLQAKRNAFRKSILSLQVNLDSFLPASKEEKEQHEIMRPSTTFFRDGMKNLMRNPLAVMSIIILVVIVLGVIFIPMFWPYGYDEIIRIDGSRDLTANSLSAFQYSTAEKAWMAQGNSVFPHIFGTDDLCRDYFIRVVFGARVSLVVGLFASLIVLLIGIVVGSISGYYGGKIDLFIMRIVDIIASLPDLLLIILLQVALSASLKPLIAGTALASVGVNMISLFIVFALLYWVGMARLVRGQILSVKENEYVLAARTLGASGGRIIKRHILPNCMSVIIISTALQIPSAIFTESFLSFIGLGVNAPMPSLGALANDARSSLDSAPSKLVFPALFICLIVLAFNLLGDALRNAFDPKLRK